MKWHYLVLLAVSFGLVSFSSKMLKLEQRIAVLEAAQQGSDDIVSNLAADVEELKDRCGPD